MIRDADDKREVKDESGPMVGGNDAKGVGDQPPQADAALPQKSGAEMKRTLTPDNVNATVADFVASAPLLVEATAKPRIPAALREKIFLAVTSVNDCRYCKWGHTRLAMAQACLLRR